MTAFRFPWDEAPVRPSRPRDARLGVAKRPRGRPKEALTTRAGTEGSAGPEPQGEGTPAGEGAALHTTWLAFWLTVGGPAGTVAAFAAAAAGPSVTPWRIDFAAMEEDVFHRLASR